MKQKIMKVLDRRNGLLYRAAAMTMAAVLFLGLTSCEEVKGEEEEYVVKDKTVLVYMIANNNLSENARANLTDMKNGFIPDPDKGNLLVYYHTQSQAPILLDIHKDKSNQTVTDTVYKFPVRNSATVESLKSAMNVVATMYPAHENGLILWSHGTGWLPTGYYENGSFPASAKFSNAQPEDALQQEVDPYADMVKMVRGGSNHNMKSFGSDDGKEIELADLAKALPYKVSYIIFDACLMGGIEVAYQLKDSTDHFVFCPTETLSTGFPYANIVSHLFSTPTDLTAVAKEFYYYYDTRNSYATISVVKTSELEGVATVAKEIFAEHRNKIESLNMRQIQRYFRQNKHWFYDLGDFIGNIASAEQMTRFSEAMDKAVIYKAATPYFIDIPIYKYSGLSTYIPNPADEQLDNFYKELEWNKAVEMVK